MTLAIFLFQIVFTPIFSQVKSSQQEIETISIGAAYKDKADVKLSDFATDIEYIPLGNNTFPLPDASRCKIIYADKDYIHFSFGSNSDKAIYKFEKNGQLAGSVVNKGRNANEFIQIIDISADEKGKMVAILDFMRVLVCTIDGQLIANVNTSNILQGYRMPLKIKIMDNRLLFICINRETHREHAIMVDFKGNLIANTPVSEPIGIVKSSSNSQAANAARMQYLNEQILLYQNSLKLLTEAEDYIYSLDESMNTTPEYKLDWNKLRNIPARKAAELNQAKYINNPAMECGRFLSFEIIFPAKTYPNMENNERIVRVIYDKADKKTSTLKYHKSFGTSGFTNDIDGGMPVNPTYIFNNRMYQIVDAADFIEYAKKGSSQKMKEIAAQLTEESNSVIVAATLK
ncbi:MAG: 6-bladed beta-propeller [Bacteroidales bacterium]|nr:6-bladed beta-propeller [Bacteroidales bacterium]